MACLVCGSVNVNFVWENGVVVAYRCANCFERWEREEPDREPDYDGILAR